MLSNSKTDYIDELYKNYTIDSVYANRSINSKGNGRGKVEEVIVTNY
jgi:DNA adenine methylase